MGGLSSVGEPLQKALKRLGFFIHSEREFPSTIKGGKASNTFNISTQPVRSLSQKIDIAIGLDREGVKDALETLSNGGILIHAFDRWNKVIKDLPAQEEAKNLRVVLIPAREIAVENGGSLIMVNTVLLGYLWKVLGFEIEILKTEIAEQFSSKPGLINLNLKCLEAGYNYDSGESLPALNIAKPVEILKTILIDGNTSLALGAIQAGVRAYYAYPMSPSTSILVYLAKVSHKTEMLVKQAEDEITAVQMALGSMHMGTRSLVFTSGGGFDLMTETISLSGMIEVPLVVGIVQRPGPATGLPTWTSQADLNLAIYSGHGEFSRIVIAVSDPTSCYLEIQNAFNLAEKYQTPVIILSEATIAMSYETVGVFEDNLIPVVRNLVKPENLESLQNSDRYKITENGISQRWLPGQSKTTFFANGDEHWEGGELTEEADKSEQMIAKRLRKTETIIAELPEPEIYGMEKTKLAIIGWGSTKNVILDAIEILKDQNIEVNYLHYTYLWPLKTDKFLKFIETNPNFFIIEGNHGGQLADLLQKETNLNPQEIDQRKLNKWNGRPFFVEEIIEFVKTKI